MSQVHDGAHEHVAPESETHEIASDPSTGVSQATPSKGRVRAPKPKPVDVEVIAKVSTITAVVSYGVGLLVTNTYLLQMGVSDFDLFKARFVTTGFLVSSLIIFATAGFWYAYWLFRNVVLGKSIVLWFRLLSIAGVPMWFLAPFGLFLLLTQRPFKALLLYWFSAFLGFLVVLVIAVIRSPTGSIGDDGKGSNKSASKKDRARQDSKQTRASLEDLPDSKTLNLIGLSVFLLLYAAVFIVLFTSNIFPVIPTQVGGGKPTPARLLFKDNSGYADLGLPLKDKQKTINVDIVFEGSDYYIIRMSGDAAVVYRIKKDDVAGVRLNVEPALDVG